MQKIAIAADQHQHSNANQGIEQIEVEGNRIDLFGWYDGVANWEVSVELTDQQWDELLAGRARRT